MNIKPRIEYYRNKIKTTFESQFTDENEIVKLENDVILNSFTNAISILFAQHDQSLDILKKEFFDHVNWGNLFNIPRNPASPSNGFVSFQGAVGGTVLQGTSIKTQSGQIYKTLTTQSVFAKTVSISAISSDGNGTITVTTTQNHNLANNFIVTISSVTNTNFNIVNTKVTVTGENTFTYNKSIALTVSTAGFVTYNILSVEIASDDNGVSTILDRNTELTLLSAVQNVNSSCFVQYTKILGGTDTELDDDYRERIKERIQNPITYFNKATIIFTAKEVSGTTRVWVSGDNYETNIRHMRDNDINAFPDAQANTNLKNYILDTIYPVAYSSDDLHVSAPQPKAYNIDISYLPAGLNDAQMQDFIITEIKALFKKTDYEKPVSIISILSAINTGAQKDGRISNTNEYDLITNAVTIDFGISDFTDMIPVLGNITF